MPDKVIDFSAPNRIEQEACEWVLKFDGGDPPKPQDVQALREWMAKSPKHEAALRHYAYLWEEMGDLSELLLVGSLKLAKRRHWARIRNGLLLPLANIALRLQQFRWRYGIGAVTLASLLLVLGWQLHWFEKSQGRYTFMTQVGETSQHQLPDGSTLWLNTNTRVKVDFSERVRRLSVLYGEAHFKVVKDVARPFEVVSEHRLVRAVGTAFSVRRMDNAVKVVVVEGKVELAALQDTTLQDAKLRDTHLQHTPPQHKKAAVAVASQPIALDSNLDNTSDNGGETPALIEKRLGFLSAGESVLLAEKAAEEGINVEEHESEELNRRLAWRKGLLIFAGEPLRAVVKEVERYTKYKIDISDQILGDIRIGGQFHVGETEALFDVLERGFGLEVSRIDDTHVLISGNTGLD